MKLRVRLTRDGGDIGLFIKIVPKTLEGLVSLRVLDLSTVKIVPRVLHNNDFLFVGLTTLGTF